MSVGRIVVFLASYGQSIAEPNTYVLKYKTQVMKHLRDKVNLSLAIEHI